MKSYKNFKNFNIADKKFNFDTKILTIPCAIDLERERVYTLHLKVPGYSTRDYLPSVIVQLARTNYLMFHNKRLSAEQTRKVLMNRTTSVKELFYKC